MEAPTPSVREVFAPRPEVCRAEGRRHRLSTSPNLTAIARPFLPQGRELSARFHRAGGRHDGDFPLPPCRPFRANGIRWPRPFPCPPPAETLTSTGRASLRTRANVLTAARVRWWARAGDQPALF